VLLLVPALLLSQLALLPQLAVLLHLQVLLLPQLAVLLHLQVLPEEFHLLLVVVSPLVVPLERVLLLPVSPVFSSLRCRLGILDHEIHATFVSPEGKFPIRDVELPINNCLQHPATIPIALHSCPVRCDLVVASLHQSSHDWCHLPWSHLATIACFTSAAHFDSLA
jgi:hypothetical protein